VKREVMTQTLYAHMNKGNFKKERKKEWLKFRETKQIQVLVAHTCNPSYLGDRDQEDQGLRPV
jgi:hypothetical protein